MYKKTEGSFEKRAWIRDYRDGDFPGIMALWEQLGLSHPDRGDSKEIVERTIALGGRLLLLFLKEPGELIGTVWLTVDGRRINMHHFGIHPDYQRQGFGFQLGTECLRFARNQHTQIRMEVNDSNEVAKRLYVKLGFLPFHNYTIYMIREVENISIPDLNEAS
jgi:[ribosomal protein S18]-alanine N-acetyltransferase